MSKNPYKVDRELKSTVEQFEFEFDPKAKEHFQQLRTANERSKTGLFGRWMFVLSFLIVIGIGTCVLQDQTPNATVAQELEEPSVMQEIKSHASGQGKIPVEIPAKKAKSIESKTAIQKEKTPVKKAQQQTIEQSPIPTSQTKVTLEKSTATPSPVSKKMPIKMETIQDIKTVKKGERILLNNLHFEAGSPVILNSSKEELDRLLQLLLANATIKVEISGYLCCNVETREGDGYDYDHLTWDLSKNRAKKVYDYLVKKGIDSSRLTYLGMGLTNPLVSFDASDAEQVLNRRVEIKILEK